MRITSECSRQVMRIMLCGSCCECSVMVLAQLSGQCLHTILGQWLLLGLWLHLTACCFPVNLFFVFFRTLAI